MTTVTVQRTPRHTAQVVAVQPLTPRMRRLTLDGPSLVGLTPRPAQDVELILHDDTGRRVKRRYTIRHARPDIGQFDVDALLHGDGPGARWAVRAHPGDQVEFFGPRGKLELTDADWHLFVGDESALPAIASLVEALPPSQLAIALIEIAAEPDRVPFGGADVRWIVRHQVPAGRPELLAEAIDAFPTPAGQGHAYLLGESRAVVALRPHVQAHGLGTEQVFVKGYWNRGRARISS